MQHIRICLVIVLLGLSVPSLAEPGWYLKPYGGFSSLSDSSGTREDGMAQSADVDLSGGFVSGLGVGYIYGDHWIAELAWEYRTNDSETSFANGTVFDDGNYASNIFYLNGYYLFDASGAWQPYLGAGVGWVQEIDIDLEGFGPEQSFSGDGEFVIQVMGGVNYMLNDRWAVNGELRYTSISEVDLEAESGATGAIKGLDYEPVSVTLGVIYRF